MQTCSKYHAQWQAVVPYCCKYTAHGARKELKKTTNLIKITPKTILRPFYNGYDITVPTEHAGTPTSWDRATISLYKYVHISTDNWNCIPKILNPDLLLKCSLFAVLGPELMPSVVFSVSPGFLQKISTRYVLQKKDSWMVGWLEGLELPFSVGISEPQDKRYCII